MLLKYHHIPLFDFQVAQGLGIGRVCSKCTPGRGAALPVERISLGSRQLLHQRGNIEGLCHFIPCEKNAQGALPVELRKQHATGKGERNFHGNHFPCKLQHGTKGQPQRKHFFATTTTIIRCCAPGSPGYFYQPAVYLSKKDITRCSARRGMSRKTSEGGKNEPVGAEVKATQAESGKNGR